MSNAAAQKRVRKRKQAIVNDYKTSHGCRDCGESDLVVLDLHHRDPEQKHEQLGYRGTRKYMQNIIQLSYFDLPLELAKCDVLCANCHRRETYRQHQDGMFLPSRGGIESTQTLFTLTG